MKNKKLIFPAACLAVALMFLCGCGGDDAAKSAANAPAVKAPVALDAVNPAVQATQAMGVIDDSQRNAAHNAMMEMQARATNIYTNNMLKGVSPNDCNAVFSAVNAEAGTLGDFSVKLTSKCPAGFDIAVLAVKGRLLADPPTGSWSFPGH